MTPLRRRPPLSDLSNLPPASSPSPAGPPAPKSIISKPINPTRNLSQQASPSFSEPLSDGAQDAAAAVAPACRTPPSTASMDMEVGSCLSTPKDMGTGEPSSRSSKEGSFIIYSRRKAAVPLHLPMSCPPPRHHFTERNLSDLNDRRKAVKRRFLTAMFSEDGRSKNGQILPSRSRRHSLPSPQPKQWLPEEFVAAQRSHFAEVDAFKLIEEEGELSDEG